MDSVFKGQIVRKKTPKNLQVSDIEFIMDSNASISSRRIWVFDETIPDSKGLVRQVKVKTNSLVRTVDEFIVPTKLAKPRPPWLLVAMSHIFIIMATSALKFSR